MKKATMLLFLLVLMLVLTSCLEPDDSVWAKKAGKAAFTPYNCSMVECRTTFSFVEGEQLWIAEPHPELGNEVYNEETDSSWWRVYNKDHIYGWVQKRGTITNPPN